ncbi:MAG: YdgA family protein [Gammaproteobacteria bacterium]|nr:YdgA family protein [Gammaproteobacteria bacterium]MDE2264210.1 YdgA family protein [Gammaproteobacteria bacterium]
MNRTTKILLAVGGIIVLSYPGLAWVSGIAIESRIQHSEQQMLDQVPYLALVRREYHRGVYRSTETATYGLRSPALQAMKGAGGAAFPSSATITIVSNIRHGPFPGLHAMALAVIDSTLVTPPALQAELGSKSILQAHTTVGLLGGATAGLSSPAFSLRLPDGSTLAWGGLTGTVTTTRGQARWSGQLNAPRLAFAGAQGGIELAGVEYSGSHAKAFDDLYLGTGTFTIERLDGSSPRSGDYSLQRISITSTSKADGEFFDLRVDAAMDAAKVAAVQLKNVTYSESLEHVHGPSLAALMRAIRGAQRQAGGNQTQLLAGVQDALRQYGADLLLHDPVLDIRQVSFTMPEGSFLLSAKVSAPGLSRADLQWPAAIVALETHAQVTADLRVDNGLVQKLLSMGGSNPKIGAQLTSLEQQGYLSAGSAAVTTHLGYSGGRLTLNGHPFPPAPPVN